MLQLPPAGPLADLLAASVLLPRLDVIRAAPADDVAAAYRGAGAATPLEAARQPPLSRAIVEATSLVPLAAQASFAADRKHRRAAGMHQWVDDVTRVASSAARRQPQHDVGERHAGQQPVTRAPQTDLPHAAKDAMPMPLRRYGSSPVLDNNTAVGYQWDGAGAAGSNIERDGADPSWYPGGGYDTGNDPAARIFERAAEVAAEQTRRQKAAALGGAPRADAGATATRSSGAVFSSLSASWVPLDRDDTAVRPWPTADATTGAANGPSDDVLPRGGGGGGRRHRPSKGTVRLTAAYSNTGFAFHPDMLLHEAHSDSEPERPDRLRAALYHLRRSGLVADERGRGGATVAVDGGEVDDRHLLRVHDRAHIANVDSTAVYGAANVSRGGSIYAGRYTARAARLAAGLVVEAAMRVARKELKNAFCLVRPPGHHAFASLASGFCFFNNVAVAVRAVQHECVFDSRPDRLSRRTESFLNDSSSTAVEKTTAGLGSHWSKRRLLPATAPPGPRRQPRMVILDWDVHHGNGTESIFWDDPSVLVVNIHQYGNRAGHIWHDERRDAVEKERKRQKRRAAAADRVEAREDENEKVDHPLAPVANVDDLLGCFDNQIDDAPVIGAADDGEQQVDPPSAAAPVTALADVAVEVPEAATSAASVMSPDPHHSRAVVLAAGSSVTDLKATHDDTAQQAADRTAKQAVTETADEDGPQLLKPTLSMDLSLLHPQNPTPQGDLVAAAGESRRPRRESAATFLARLHDQLKAVDQPLVATAGPDAVRRGEPQDATTAAISATDDVALQYFGRLATGDEGATVRRPKKTLALGSSGSLDTDDENTEDASSSGSQSSTSSSSTPGRGATPRAAAHLRGGAVKNGFGPHANGGTTMDTPSATTSSPSSSASSAQSSGARSQPSFYPGTGALDDDGGGAGAPGHGATVNVPLPCWGFGDAEYLLLFDDCLLPLIRDFGPDMIFISCGVDSADGDSLGSMKLTPTGYYLMTRKLLGVCPKVVAVLEGGYTLKNVSLCVEAVIRALKESADCCVDGVIAKASKRTRASLDSNGGMEGERPPERQHSTQQPRGKVMRSRMLVHQMSRTIDDVAEQHRWKYPSLGGRRLPPSVDDADEDDLIGAKRSRSRHVDSAGFGRRLDDEDDDVFATYRRMRRRRAFALEEDATADARAVLLTGCSPTLAVGRDAYSSSAPHRYWPHEPPPRRAGTDREDDEDDQPAMLIGHGLAAEGDEYPLPAFLRRRRDAARWYHLDGGQTATGEAEHAASARVPPLPGDGQDAGHGGDQRDGAHAETYLADGRGDQPATTGRFAGALGPPLAERTRRSRAAPRDNSVADAVDPQRGDSTRVDDPTAQGRASPEAHPVVDDAAGGVTLDAMPPHLAETAAPRDRVARHVSDSVGTENRAPLVAPPPLLGTRNVSPTLM